MPPFALVSALGEDTGGGVYAFDGERVAQVDRLSTTGLAVRDGTVARLVWSAGEVGSVGEILVSDERGVRSYWRVDELREGHDIAWDGEDLLAVSTMSNAVLRLDPSGTVTSTWKAPGTGDAWHLNSLLVDGARLLVTAFGRFREHREWSGAADGSGVVVDLSDERDVLTGLSHPHHPRRDDGTWLVCNSGTGEVLRLAGDGRTVLDRADLGGWTRGLAIADTEVYVGVSGDRDRLAADELASIAVLRRDDLTLLRRIPLPCREIYDIVIADPALAEGMRRGFRTNPTRTAEQDQHALFDAAGIRPQRLWALGNPLPASACDVRLAAQVPKALTAASLAELSIEIQNDGPEFLVSAPPNPVHVSYRWIGPNGLAAEGMRSRLREPVPPQGRIDSTFGVQAPAEPGAYRLVVTLVQEDVRWFDEVGPSNASVHDVVIEA